MPKSFFVGALVAVVLYLGSVFAPWGATVASPSRLEPKDTQSVAELSDAMTPQQVSHSRINANEYVPEGAIPVRDLPASYPGETTIGLSTSDMVVDFDGSIDQRLSRMVSASDAILVGVVEGGESKVSADGYSLFTDYRVRVADVVTSNVAARLSPGGVITVTRRGGRARVSGVEVTTEFNRSPILDVGGRRLLLFLKYLPETNDFECNGEDSAFVVKRSGVEPVSSVGADLTPLGDVEQLKNAVRAATAERR